MTRRVRWGGPLTTVVVSLAAIGPALAAPVLDRNVVPKPGTVRPFRFPDWETRRLSNGLPVLIVVRHDHPIVDVQYVLRGGANSDPAGKSGLAQLAATVWTKGAGNRSAADIDDAVEFYGASLGASAQRQTTELEMTTPSEHFPTLLPLFAEIAQRPSVAEAEVTRARDIAVTDLRQAEDKVSELADRALMEHLFPGHPFSHLVQGSRTSVTGLTHADVEGFFRTRLVPANAMLVVSGDVTLPVLMPQLEKLFGKTSAGRAPVAEVPAPRPVGRTTVTVIDKPGAVQSAVRVASLGLTPHDPDADAWEVANALLGGLFTSRLNHNLRETKGYTYGAGTRFSRWEQPGYITARTNVESKVTVPAVGEILKEFDRIRQEPVPADELNKAKQFLIGTYVNTYETAGDIADAITDLTLLRLPVSHIRGYRERIARVSAADVQRVCRRFLNPDHLTIVVAGDAKQLDGMQAYGPVIRMTAAAVSAAP